MFPDFELTTDSPSDALPISFYRVFVNNCECPKRTGFDSYITIFIFMINNQSCVDRVPGRRSCAGHETLNVISKSAVNMV